MTVRRPTGSTPKSAAVGAKRPKSQTLGQWIGGNRSGRPRSGAEGAASLDTGVVTQPAEPLSKTPDRHNSTAKRLRILTPRTEWLANVQAASALYREQSARKFDERSRAVGLERRREWRELRNVWRDRRTGRTSSGGETVHRLERPKAELARVFNDPRVGEDRGRLGPRPFPDLASYVDREWAPANEVSEQIGGAPPLESHWHSSRAKTKRELFDRVATCGTAEAHKITLVCRSCKDATEIEVGCGSKWFCPTCRLRQVIKFRKDFERKRVGLLQAADRAGLTRRRQKKSERWGARLLTFTLPSVGTPEERIEVLRATWLRFWRLLRDRLRPTLQGSSGISFDVQAHNFPDGLPEDAITRDEDGLPVARELSLLEVLSYLHVFEWTPGDVDLLGHPHLHVWMFSRYIDNKEVLHPLWERAYWEVRRAALPVGPIQEVKLLIPDARVAGDDVATELVKYLTKDWEITETGAKRADPDVFARVYAALDGRRLKQSSAGFARWAVERINVCPCCAYENARGHWARVDITHTLEDVTAKLGRHVPTGHFVDADGRYTPTPLAGAEEFKLRAAHDAGKDREWLTSHERTIARARMLGLGVGPIEHAAATEEPTQESEATWEQTDLW